MIGIGGDFYKYKFSLFFRPSCAAASSALNIINKYTIP